MGTRWLIAILCAVCTWVSGVYAADPLPTGQFVLPFNANQSWPKGLPTCTTTGYVQPNEEPRDSHQYYMELNREILPSPGKYHVGEDWNGRCGSNTDLDGPLYALADGTVLSVDSVDDSARGKWISIRYRFPYAKGTNGVAVMDSEYLHLNTVEPGIAIDAKVVRGQKVATIGGTGGWPVHLHWDALWNKSAPVTNLYQNPLKKADALKYRAPSLIVDDRRTERAVTPSAPNSWVTFLMGETENAPSSTAYVSKDGVNKTLEQAISAGWMALPDLMFWDNTNQRWDSYANIDGAFFHNGSYYAFKAKLSGVALHIPVPGNHFRDDRARLDMILAVNTKAAFISVKTEIWTSNLNWDPNYELRKMGFSTTTGERCVAQATHKTNPVLRYTAISSTTCSLSMSDSWTAWEWVDWNQLY